MAIERSLEKCFFTMVTEDVTDFVALMEGYFRTLVSDTGSLLGDSGDMATQDPGWYMNISSIIKQISMAIGSVYNFLGLYQAVKSHYLNLIRYLRV